MTATAGFRAGVYITATPSIAFTQEALVDSGDHKTWNTSGATHQCWDKRHTWLVETSPDGGSWTTVTSGFAMHYPVGRIIFKTTVAGSSPRVRVSGAYFTYSFLSYGHNIELATETDIYETTSYTYPSSTWKTYIQGILGATVKVEHFWIDDTLLSTLISEDLLILKIYPDTAQTGHFQCYAPAKQSTLKTAVDSLADEGMTFQIDGHMYYLSA